MPSFSQEASLQKFYLPSMKDVEQEPDRGWVVMDVSPQKASDMIGFAPGMTLAEMGIAMLSGRIREWNNTDDSGELQPITPASVGALRTDDFDFLREKIQAESTELDIDEKKASPSTSPKSETENASQ